MIGIEKSVLQRSAKRKIRSSSSSSSSSAYSSSDGEASIGSTEKRVLKRYEGALLHLKDKSRNESIPKNVQNIVRAIARVRI
jgi:hypothetical protein